MNLRLRFINIVDFSTNTFYLFNYKGIAIEFTSFEKKKNVFPYTTLFNDFTIN